MAAQIVIPAILRTLTAGADTLAAEGNTVAEVIDRLDARFPGMKARLCDQDGNVLRFINIYLNGEDIRFLDSLKTPVGPSDEIAVVAAIAGG